MSRIVNLNVGGTKYTTSISTIMKFPESMLGAMMQQPQESQMIQDGQEIFIDRNGDAFKYVLEYLRDGDMFVLPEEDVASLKQLLLEAQFFMLDGLKAMIEKKLRVLTKDGWNIGDFVSLGDVRTMELMSTYYIFKEFREQGFCRIGDTVGGTIVQIGNDGKFAVRLTFQMWNKPSVESVQEISAIYMLPYVPKLVEFTLSRSEQFFFAFYV